MGSVIGQRLQKAESEEAVSHKVSGMEEIPLGRPGYLLFCRGSLNLNFRIDVNESSTALKILVFS